jgi:hypothetical protein
MGRASTIFNADRYLGGAIGVALYTTSIVAVGQTQVLGGRIVANFASYRAAWFVAAGVSLVGAIMALGIKDADAVATVVVRARRRPVAQASLELEGALKP